MRLRDLFWRRLSLSDIARGATMLDQREAGHRPAGQVSLMPIANARMYSATPAVKQAWKDVLGWALRRAGLEWDFLDHDAPAPLGALWSRPDLGLAMMCGLPYSQRKPRPQIIAAPVPSPARYQGRPVYFTDIAVRADSPHQRLEDTFGGVVGYTLEDSMSGCVAFRRYLLQFRHSEQPLFGKAVGGFVNARQVIEALSAGKIDVGPLDSYYYDLLRKNDPTFAAQVRVVATTAAAPIPPLIATADVAPQDVRALREGLQQAASAPQLAQQRDMLLLLGFAVPQASDYAAFDGILAESNRFPGTW
jgi:ABC-type phosphate/phosphonate transport system substrate-binding protein